MNAEIRITIRETDVMGVTCLNVEVRNPGWVVYGTFEGAGSAADFAASWAHFFLEHGVKGA